MSGFCIMVLKDKLKRLNHNLKIWNNKAFGNISYTTQNIIRKINELEKMDDISDLDIDMKLER